MLRGFIGALPDLHAAEQDIVAAGDTVAVRYLVEAMHEGNLLGIAQTGRRVRWDAVDIYRLAGGMIVEWAADDTTAILYQAGRTRRRGSRLQGQPTRTEPGDQDRGGRPGQGQQRSRCNRRGAGRLRRQDRSGAEVEVAS
jgi:SnoaL-like polyketide cyclase